MDWLGIVWWAAALGGAVSVVVGIFAERHRATALWVATAGFAVAGVLGLASIGIVFLLAAGVCAAAAFRMGRQPSPLR